MESWMWIPPDKFGPGTDISVQLKLELKEALNRVK